MQTTMGTMVLIATPLEPELVRRIEHGEPRATVLYEPELLPPPRYPCDHRGADGFQRDEAGERRWRELLDRAEVLFGIPGESPEELARVVREHSGVRWIQAMYAGAGQQVRAAGLTPEELERVAVTTTSGVHAGPLAEFAMLGLLTFTKDLPRLLRDKRRRHWDHYPMRELAGQTLLVVGLGEIGMEVARQASCLGMRVLGVRRRRGRRPKWVAEVHATTDLPELLPRADAVVVSLPGTPATEGLFDRELIGRMRPGAIFVNVGRGTVVDEGALTEALLAGHLAGAALDVFATEPLPLDSALWDLPNVLLSPHTAALSARENQRIVERFADNLRRYLDGDPLRNRIDPVEFY
jgi:phosphoglycerate dehydrogenase-like enzyme